MPKLFTHAPAIFSPEPAKGWRPWGLLVPILGLFFVIATSAGIPESFGGRLAWALVAFPVVVALSAVTYRTIEAPFLAFRRNYLVPVGK